MSVVTDILARLSGKVRAWDTTEEVAEQLDEQTTRIHDTLLPVHLVGAAALADQLSYQPGLLDLRGEVYEGALYLEALLTAARAAGYGDLAKRLAETAEALHEATVLLSAATHATVRGPQIPLTEAA